MTQPVTLAAPHTAGATGCAICGPLGCGGRAFPDIEHSADYPFLPGGTPMAPQTEHVAPSRLFDQRGILVVAEGARIPADAPALYDEKGALYVTEAEREAAEAAAAEAEKQRLAAEEAARAEAERVATEKAEADRAAAEQAAAQAQAQEASVAEEKSAEEQAENTTAATKSAKRGPKRETRST